MTKEATMESQQQALTPAQDLERVMSTAEAQSVAGQAQIQRSVAEVQGAIISAKKFPRDQFTAINRIRTACARLGLAERALYRYERGGEMVTGASIRLAEALALNWGNVDFGMRELGRSADESEMEAYAWDMETNARTTRVFRVPHVRTSRKRGSVKLTDPRDVYEMTANMGARRMRACILAIVPSDVVDLAVDACKQTVANGDGRPMEDRIRDMVTAFAEVGVPQGAVETRMGHPLAVTTAEELVDLVAIYRGIKDGHSRRERFFEIAGHAGETEAASALNERYSPQGEAK
jgi:hypothetical protein